MDTKNDSRHFPPIPSSKPFLACFARERDMPPSNPLAHLPHHPFPRIPLRPPFAAPSVPKLPI